MHLEFKSQPKIKPADERDLRIWKSRVRLFKRVISVGLVHWRSDHLVVLKPGESGSLRGVMFSAPTLILGWWSVSGWLHTCYALSHNVLGGVDVTDLIKGNELREKARESESFKSRRFALCLVFAMGMMCAAFFLLVKMLGADGKN